MNAIRGPVYGKRVCYESLKISSILTEGELSFDPVIQSSERGECIRKSVYRVGRPCCNIIPLSKRNMHTMDH